MIRLAAYEDAIYHRDGAGIYVHRAFPLFMAGLADEVDSLTLLGRLHPAPGRSHFALPTAVEFIALPYYESLAHPLQLGRALIGTLRTFWRVLGSVDAIWVNGPQPVAVLAVVLAKLRRRTVFLGVRQNTIEYARSRHPGRRLPLLAFRMLEGVWRRLARSCPVVVVGPELAKLYGNAPRLLEIGVSFVSDDDIAAASDPEWVDQLRVLSVGRLEAEKNPLMLADVLSELDKDGRDWQLLVCGEGPLETPLRRRLEELGVEQRARLLGYVPVDAGLLEHYRNSHAFLHVSWTEGVPQVLFEAFASGVPVVATDVGGVAAVTGDAALLVPPGDPAAAAAALRRLAEEPELRERLTAAGAERVRAYTREAQSRRLAGWMRDVALKR